MGRPMGISERQIVAFRAVMLTGSMTGAARHLNVSQPSLSTLIKRLEDIIGTSLFERSGGRLIPSIEAQQIFVAVERVFGQFDELVRSIQSIARSENSIFRVGMSPGICRKIGPRVFARLLVDRPDLRLFCDNLSRDRIVDYLLCGRGECIATIVPIKDNSISSTIVGRARLCCVVPKDHQLAEMRSVTARDLTAERLISFEHDTPHGSLVSAVFADMSLVPNIRVFVRSTETAISCVQERIGISIVDDFAAFECEDIGLAAIPMAASPSVPIYVHWSRHRPRTRLVPEFVAALRSTLANVVNRRVGNAKLNGLMFDAVTVSSGDGHLPPSA